MASTYVNDLRLNEMATGDASGSWGTNTNTNLELIGEALGYGTEGITTNADTHTTTVADGATDPGRSMYLEYTGTLDSACTITIAPNTLSRMHFIENGTSGSQNIIISQGSGANITIPPGDTKAVYLDGAGSGAAVVDAFASLNVVDLKVQDDLTVTDDLTVGGDIDLEGAIDVNGTANLDVVDIDGAVNMATTALVTGVLTTTATQVATGGITSGSDIISDTDSTDSLGSTGVRWLKGWFDTLAAGTLTLGSGSVTDSSGAISFGNENLTTTGIVTAAGTSVFTNLDISGDVDVDGTLEADAITLGGTALGSIYSPIAGGTGILTTGALDAGSITSGFGTINNGASAITTTGVGSFASLDISGAIDVDGTSNLDVVDIDGAVDFASTTAHAGNATFADNAKAIFGAGDDLQIYHDGSDSIIADVGTGDLLIRSSDDLRFQNAGGTETFMVLNDNSSVNLYFNNGVKLATTSTGIDVTGTVTATGTSVFASLDISGDIDVDGTTNLDVVDIDGAVDMASTLTVNGVTTINSSVDQIFNLNSTDSGAVYTAFKRGGTRKAYFGFSSGGDNVVLANEISNGDIQFLGNDGGSSITALALDMSAAGAATFNSSVIATSLDISGDVDVDGTLETDNLTVGGAQGTDGQVLTSTGSGVGWEDAAGGGVTFKAFGTSSLMVGDSATGTIDAANYNTALGVDVFAALTSGDNNIAVGFQALTANTTASNNVAIGYNAGLSVTTGASNTFVGGLAGDATDDGHSNVAVGYQALTSNCANYNTAVGHIALKNCNTGGNNNTGVGMGAGYDITNGDNNTCLGQGAGNTGNPGGAITTASNRIALGDDAVTHIYAQISSITGASDARDKTDFTPLDLGLDFVKALAPVTYKWDKRSKYGDKTAEGYDLTAQTPDGTHKEDWLDVGFTAQAVEALENAAGYSTDTNTNLIYDINPDGKSMGLQYTKFIPILVKAIQEQNALIEALTARVTTLEG